MIKKNRIARRQQIANVASIPAPTGGLNARDAYAAMPPTDALVMDNMFPTPSYVGVRQGTSAWVTGPSVSTLACYSSAGGSRKLFAAAAGNIYDVTARGALGAAVVSGNTTDWWRYVNFGAGGGQYLFMVNGQDAPLLYSGTAWQTVTNASAPIAITGVTPSTFVNVNGFQGRLYFIIKNSMKVAYLPLLSVGGAASILDLSSQTLLGGYLVTMATWTIETAFGMTEMACFITSEGEVLVYQGNDPTFASSWYKLGTFRIGRPIGYRCTVRMGSDVAVITADGLVPLSKALLTDRTQNAIAISDKIQNLINTDVQTYAANLGWQAILHPIGNKLILNVPASSAAYQYVQNTVNNSWCRFTGWNPTCFELVGDSLYYGNSTGVYLCDVGYTDNGSSINAVCIQAASYFGTQSNKQATMARPTFTSNGPVSPSFQVNADYNLTPPANQNTYSTAAYTYWGAPWFSAWSPALAVYKNWQSVSGIGYALSPAMSLAVNGLTVSWNATDIAYIEGGTL
jgi:hypothetical protein